MNPEWMVDALCKQTHPDAFFPDHGETGIKAKRICASCDVRAQCLEYALTHGETIGVWGGLSAGERGRLAAARREAVA